MICFKNLDLFVSLIPLRVIEHHYYRRITFNLVKTCKLCLDFRAYVVQPRSALVDVRLSSYYAQMVSKVSMCDQNQSSLRLINLTQMVHGPAVTAIAYQPMYVLPQWIQIPSVTRKYKWKNTFQVAFGTSVALSMCNVCIFRHVYWGETGFTDAEPCRISSVFSIHIFQHTDWFGQKVASGLLTTLFKNLNWFVKTMAVRRGCFLLYI